ncbi:hypothetical protein DAPPUDRAFT_64905 [Daphnia pulex]|uniref:AB hydrolase-1 domain-containing protein n=1 Tax=Daphnia pulex TaxID=6669 RepID=E9HPV8_DAPPU|nr:hypothetical protein DAPPUDRAFT_64905 [Daphnia pulex]|eukprot:EFX66233.1 hypothetical protein DAPPUDRAFT_64905 [Daphnia pulex]
MDLDVQQRCRNTPLVMIPGFGSAAALFCLNFDTLARDRPVNALDILGFGSSSRPQISSNALEAETEMVKTILEWRKKVGLMGKFFLLGHSMGGYIAGAYALQYPDRVLHVVLADPWGFPYIPNGNDCIGITVVNIPFTPIFYSNNSEPIGVIRMALFTQIPPNMNAEIYYDSEVSTKPGLSNAQITEHLIMDLFEWAKYPMVHRIPALRSDVPLTFIYGAESWVDRPVFFHCSVECLNQEVFIQIICGVGHHIYADKPEQFHRLVLTACWTTEN